MRLHLIECGSQTVQCPLCNKYIPRSIIVYHIDQNCVNPNLFQQDIQMQTTLMNSYIRDQYKKESSQKFQPLFEKGSHIRQSLHKVYYPSEIDHVTEKVQFNIIIMGSPRVGKSELINALCNGEIRAETSLSLNSCTKEVKCYVLEDKRHRSENEKAFKINFYDTPGIESWNNNDGQTNMIEFIEQTNPVCVIYCASPGSFAKLDQLQSVLQYCHRKQIFCALVCTNMWSGNSREYVIEEFQKQLQFFGEKIEKYSYQSIYRNSHKITFFGTGALCTMINSVIYFDPEFSDKRMPVQGVDELIHGIMESLSSEKLLGWCYTVLYRRSYWQKITQKIGGFFSFHLTDFYRRIIQSSDQTATHFLTYFNQNILKKE